MRQALACILPAGQPAALSVARPPAQLSRLPCFAALLPAAAAFPGLPVRPHAAAQRDRRRAPPPPPVRLQWWQVIIVNVARQASKGCGDLIFSSHLTFLLTFTWTYAVLGHSLLLKALWFAYTCATALCIIASRKQ